ncbi:YceI family protein [Glaesserella sp.]|uniref:YceI family protein n=1 Tax=Glaesserella sp. TaxID=2094731 RepID=UPI0035A17783
MKKLLFTAILAGFAANATAATYKIDPFHTNARFEIDHFGTSSNVGGFYGLNGTLEFDPKKQTGSVDLVIPVSSLQSSSAEFTQHLKSADLLDEAKSPQIRFVSKNFKFDGGKVTDVTGELTILGKTHPVTLKADKFNCYDSPMLKTEVCGGDFSTTIDRTLWGVNYLVDVGMTKDVKINIQIEAGKQ